MSYNPRPKKTATATTTFSCPICLGENQNQTSSSSSSSDPAFELTSTCHHKFCTQCLLAYVRSKLLDGVIDIPCCHFKVPQLLEDDDDDFGFRPCNVLLQEDDIYRLVHSIDVNVNDDCDNGSNTNNSLSCHNSVCCSHDCNHNFCTFLKQEDINNKKQQQQQQQQKKENELWTKYQKLKFDIHHGKECVRRCPKCDEARLFDEECMKLYRSNHLTIPLRQSPPLVVGRNNRNGTGNSRNILERIFGGVFRPNDDDGRNGRSNNGGGVPEATPGAIPGAADDDDDGTTTSTTDAVDHRDNGLRRRINDDDDDDDDGICRRVALPNGTTADTIPNAAAATVCTPCDNDDTIINSNPRYEEGGDSVENERKTLTTDGDGSLKGEKSTPLSPVDNEEETSLKEGGSVIEAKGTSNGEDDNILHENYGPTPLCPMYDDKEEAGNTQQGDRYIESMRASADLTDEVKQSELCPLEERGDSVEEEKEETSKELDCVGDELSKDDKSTPLSPRDDENGTSLVEAGDIDVEETGTPNKEDNDKSHEGDSPTPLTPIGNQGEASNSRDRETTDQISTNNKPSKKSADSTIATDDTQSQSLVKSTTPIVTCHVCSTEFCYFHSNAHSGKSCIEYHTTNLETDRTNAEFASAILRAKPCPNCGISVSKDGGCNQMKCGSCGTHFCWLCSEIVDDGAFPEHFRWWNLRGCANMQLDENDEPLRCTVCMARVLSALQILVLGVPSVVLTLVSMMLCPCLVPGCGRTNRERVVNCVSFWGSFLSSMLALPFTCLGMLVVSALYCFAAAMTCFFKVLTRTTGGGGGGRRQQQRRAGAPSSIDLDNVTRRGSSGNRGVSSNRDVPMGDAGNNAASADFMRELESIFDRIEEGRATVNAH